MIALLPLSIYVTSDVPIINFTIFYSIQLETDTVYFLTRCFYVIMFDILLWDKMSLELGQ